MSDPVPALLKGTLDLLILRTLELQPLHGAAIAERIFQTTRGTFQIKAGSLFRGVPTDVFDRRALSRAPSSGAERIARGRVGSTTEGPPHQVLPSHARRTPPSIG